MKFKDVLGWDHESDVGDPIDKSGKNQMVFHKVSGKDAYTVLYKGDPVESRICSVVGKSYDRELDLLILNTDQGVVSYGFRKPRNVLAQLTRDFADSCYSLYTDTGMWLDTRNLFDSGETGLTFLGSRVDDWKKYGPVYKILCGDEVYWIHLTEEGKSRITKTYLHESTVFDNIVRWIKGFIQDITDLVEVSNDES